MITIIVTVLVLVYKSFCNTACIYGNANKASCCCCCTLLKVFPTNILGWGRSTLMVHNNLPVFHRDKTVAKFSIRLSRLPLSALFCKYWFESNITRVEDILDNKIMFYPLPLHPLFRINQVYPKPLGLRTKKALFWQKQK